MLPRWKSGGHRHLQETPYPTDIFLRVLACSCLSGSLSLLSRLCTEANPPPWLNAVIRKMKAEKKMREKGHQCEMAARDRKQVALLIVFAADCVCLALYV